MNICPGCNTHCPAVLLTNGICPGCSTAESSAGRPLSVAQNPQPPNTSEGGQPMKKLEAALKRAGWTVAQAALGVIGATALLEDVNWGLVGSTALMAGIVSLLKSVKFTPPEATS